MKILELRFKNLNSLYGEWRIDFSHPDFASNGIFAITGPTGAGKSTLLDAICLALYGATPRLGKITKSANELMSQQSGECFAEVTFVSQAGKFRCHWSQHRARKKIDGVLAESRHEIVDAETNQILESKKREVALVIEEKTGMDFERFTRSILLAQGGFAAFLMATADERAPILEQITGTEIYSQISKTVHETLRGAREKLEQLTAETKGITLLSEAQEQAHHQMLAELKQQFELLHAREHELKTAQQWLLMLEKLSKEKAQLSQDYTQIEIKINNFRPERERLAAAEKALEIDGLYAQYTLLRKQQQADTTAREEAMIRLPAAQAAWQDDEQRLSVAQEKRSQVKEEQKSLAPLLKQAGSLDQSLLEKTKAIQAIESHTKSLTQQVNNKINELKALDTRKTESQQALASIDNYLQTHAIDSQLLPELAATKEQLKSRSHWAVALSEKNRLLQEAQLTLENNASRSLDLQRLLLEKDQAVALIQTQMSDLGQQLERWLENRLLREYRAEKEALLREMAFLQKIASLETERQRLRDGEPCPLCGSRAHPFAQESPALDQTEIRIQQLTGRIEQAEKCQEQIDNLSREVQLALNQKTLIQQQVNDAENEKNNLVQRLVELEAQKSQLEADNLLCQQEILQRLEPFGIDKSADLERIIDSLQARLAIWNQQQQEKSRLEQLDAVLQLEIKPLEALIDNHQQGLLQYQQDVIALQADYAETKKKRFELLQEKSVDEEEQRLQKAMFDAEQNEQLVSQARDLGKADFDSIQRSIQSLNKQLAERQPHLAQVESDFNSAIINAGFADEADFCIGLMNPAERNNLALKARELDNQKTLIEQGLKDKQQSLDTELTKQITTEPLPLILAELEAITPQLATMNQDMAIIHVDLKHHEENKVRLQEKQELIDAQRMDYVRMEKLHALIGSADGKKYRNFAQGLTFELMVFHANKQLEKMTDRYLLIRDKDQPLELNVMDNYQAGEIRTTRNLSGGESFIVSLSLALGLSKMASQKVRVDSLFLDEGFGTLDDEALETALETLSELQHDGKIIGIISHVQALKERISTQINVQPVSGGRSAVVGPGCCRVEALIRANEPVS